MSRQEGLGEVHQEIYERVLNAVAGHFDYNGRLKPDDALEAISPIREEYVAYGHRPEVVDVLGVAAMREARGRAMELVGLRDTFPGLSPTELGLL